jgi:hypothetical protein
VRKVLLFYPFYRGGNRSIAKGMVVLGFKPEKFSVIYGLNH